MSRARVGRALTCRQSVSHPMELYQAVQNFLAMGHSRVHFLGLTHCRCAPNSMSQPVLWLLGLLGVAVLSIACLFMNAPGMEADIGERVAVPGYTTSVSGRDVTLTGTVPTEAAKLEAGAAALAEPGVARVFNNLEVAGDGAPADVGAADVAAGGSFAVMAPPNGPVVVRATVGDEAMREPILERVRAAYPGREVIDEITVGDGAATAWEPSIMALLPLLSDVENPALRVDGGQVVLRGTVPSEEIRAQVEEAARAAVQAPYTFRSELVVAGDSGSGQITSSGSSDADMQEAEDALREALSIGFVEFQSGTATLTAQSREILDRAAEVFARFPGLGAEVQGHTDSQGNDASNQALSQRRAEAVRDYLVDQNVNDAQLTPRGYGETEPIADNETSEGRARNRRVVFSLRSL